MQSSVLRFLSQLRETVPEAERIFTEGGCYRLFLLLRTIWTDAEPLYDGNHVITRIDGKCYDITGRVFSKAHVSMFQERRLIKKAHRWFRAV